MQVLIDRISLFFITGTIVVRILVFPLVIKSQRNAAKMRNHMPEMQVIQLKMTEARQTGDALMGKSLRETCL